MANLSPFDVSKSIMKKERISDEEVDGLSKWMLNKIFSCDQQICIVSNQLNNEFVTPRMVYDCYYHFLPHMPKKYIPYLAKKATVEKEMRYIMEYFQVNQNVAKQYQKLIGDDEKQKIVDFFEKRGVKK